MGFILPAIASALISKAIAGGGQQQSQSPIFQYQRRPRVPITPLPDNWMLRGGNPADARLAESPIIQAMNAVPTPEASKPQGEGEKFNLKNQFLSSLTNNLLQRVIFGGPQQSYSYAPPTFR